MKKKRRTPAQGQGGPQAAESAESERSNHVEHGQETSSSAKIEDEVERPGALTQFQIEAVQRLWRLGLAVSEIKSVTGVRESTIYKHVKGIARDPPESNNRSEGIPVNNVLAEQDTAGQKIGKPDLEITDTNGRRVPRINHEVSVPPPKIVDYPGDTDSAPQDSASHGITRLRFYVPVELSPETVLLLQSEARALGHSDADSLVVDLIRYMRREGNYDQTRKSVDLERQVKERSPLHRLQKTVLDMYELKCLAAVSNNRDMPAPPLLPGTPGYQETLKLREKEKVKAAGRKRKADLRSLTIIAMNGWGRGGEDYVVGKLQYLLALKHMNEDTNLVPSPREIRKVLAEVGYKDPAKLSSTFLGTNGPDPTL